MFPISLIPSSPLRFKSLTNSRNLPITENVNNVHTVTNFLSYVQTESTSVPEMAWGQVKRSKVKTCHDDMVKWDCVLCAEVINKRWDELEENYLQTLQDGFRLLIRERQRTIPLLIEVIFSAYHSYVVVAENVINFQVGLKTVLISQGFWYKISK